MTSPAYPGQRGIIAERRHQRYLVGVGVGGCYRRSRLVVTTGHRQKVVVVECINARHNNE